jgi:hypothetical protein
MEQSMGMTVGFRGRTIQKQYSQLPQEMQDMAEALMKELEVIGPKLPKWPHFGPLRGKPKKRKVYHAHLNKGKPTYVAVWELVGEDEIEILFLGTHEKAAYDRL